MENPVSMIMGALPDLSIRKALKTILDALGDRVSTRMASQAGLVHGAAALVAKTGAAACYLFVNGQLATIGAAVNMPALAGSVTNLKFNVYVYYQDSAAVRTAVMGTEGASLAAIVFPPTPRQKAIIGFSIVNPTGAGNFVGGTTALDDITVVPNAVHISAAAGMDPTILLG